jgi:cobalamin biosynthesis protein CobT
MGRRILNRKELRADYDEAERRKQPSDEDQEVEGEAEDEDEDEDEEAEGEEAEAEGEEDEEAAAAAATKKKKAPPKPKPKAKPRTRTAKVTRMRVVWGVFNNSNQQVTTYEYPKKDEALAHAAKLTADKKSTHFVQPVKEPMEEKKE